MVAFYDNGPAKCFALSGKTKGPVIGIADADRSGGQPIPVILQGISTHHSALTTGRPYYAGDDGALDEDPTHIQIGQALSDTQLLLNVQRP
jgi:hypothetical protein